MPRTDETDSGLWPTPLAQEAKHAAPTEWEMTTDQKSVKNSLRIRVAKAGPPMWPTPTAALSPEQGQRCNRQTSPGKPGKRSEDHVNANDVANAEVEGLEGHRRRDEMERAEHSRRDAPTSRWPTRQDTWRTEPDVGRVANGIPGRVDRLKGLGNAIVPQVAEQIGIAIRQWEQKSD